MIILGQFCLVAAQGCSICLCQCTAIIAGASLLSSRHIEQGVLCTVLHL